MSLTDKIKSAIPGTIDDKIIDQVVESTQSVRDGATNTGLKGANMVDEAMNKLTDAIPGTLDDKAYNKVKDLLGGDKTGDEN
ncbi:TPA: hypothetical protein EYO12_03650 [Candidatus Saccharibacteria bacterium]|nr:hypothetical protein [Candidatus Saccharibacteria bacterium]HIO87874.1 hypothetical protein [Candidatus Saccharibacteria bacterium]